jgi:hypothetical protein
MSMLARTVAAVLASLLLALPAVAAAGAPYGAESPQALVARMEAAAEKGDLPEMMACIAPDARREMALGLVAGAGLMVAFMGMGGAMAEGMGEALAEGMTGEEMTAEQKAEMEAGQKAMEAKAAELQKRYEGILERHGVTAMMSDETPLPEDPAARSAALAKLFEKTDDVALVTDLLGLMSELGESEGEGAGGPGSPVTLPGEVGGYEIQGDRATAKAGEETIEFVKVDGRWYFQPTDDAPPAPPSTPNP